MISALPKSLFSIDSLTKHHEKEIQRHFLELSEEDKNLRFMCNPKEEVISKYVSEMFQNSIIFGAKVESKLVGVAQLSFYEDQQGLRFCEVALSVDVAYRKLGIGKAFIQKAKEEAKCTIKMIFKKENFCLKDLLTKMGAEIQVCNDYLEVIILS